MKENRSKNSSLSTKNFTSSSLQILNVGICKTKNTTSLILASNYKLGKNAQDGKSFLSTCKFLRTGKISQL